MIRTSRVRRGDAAYGKATAVVNDSLDSRDSHRHNNELGVTHAESKNNTELMVQMHASHYRVYAAHLHEIDISGLRCGSGAKPYVPGCVQLLFVRARFPLWTTPICSYTR